MTLSVAVVCEAPADQRTGCGLADRVLCDKLRWLEREMLPAVRRWRGFAEHETCLLWRDIPDLAHACGIRPHGHFDGLPGELDAGATRKALFLLNTIRDRLDAVVLLRDDDATMERRKGLEQGRAASPVRVPVVLGLACANRECWVLAGFQPRNAREQESLDAIRKEIGFDPRDAAERLTAKHLGDKHNAKRVLARLTDGDRDREERCWKEADLHVMEQRGRKSGLVDYLGEVRVLLVPLIGK